MKRIDLNGEWRLEGAGYKDIKAAVPGCVHTDLMAASLISDPYYRDNEKKLLWIGECDWKYERCFEVTQDFLQEESIILVCNGLDTLSEITINGKSAGQTTNMFRKWEFDIRPLLVPGLNKISILFKSTYPYIKEKMSHRWLYHSGIGQYRVEGHNMVRKMHSNYGWDWGPVCVTCGIWRDIGIQAFSTGRFESVLITQQHEKEHVNLGIKVNLNKNHKECELWLTISFQGVKMASSKRRGCSGNIDILTGIENPKLWWPNGLGEQPLYDIRLELVHKSEIIDVYQCRIGLRTLRLDRHPDEWGESFQFTVNGFPFFAKGANWIPIDTFVTRGSVDFYRQLLQDARKANMNFIRVWGGGIYEQDYFYDICDELGLCVWQDFMFACSAYPVYDREFLENVKQEASENIQRIANHSCLALWCGNNELEQIGGCINEEGSDGAMTWEEYSLLFDHILPELTRKYAPQTDYWPSSCCTLTGDRKDFNNPDSGDAHLWGVWHGKQPFEWYRTCQHRFNSEFGFQSFPEPRIINGFTEPEDRNITSYIMELHQKSDIGNDAIMQYMLAWYKLPKNFNMLVWVSQILQGMAMKYAVEHWRRNMPRSMGAIYWQLNDCWPVASWSSIDFEGNWKALHYMARHFFAPVLLSVVEDMDKGTLEIHLTNDTPNVTSGKVVSRLFDFNGGLRREDRIAASMDSNRTGVIGQLDYSKQIEQTGKRDCMVYLQYESEDKLVSENIVFFSRPKHMNLKTNTLSCYVQKTGKGAFDIHLSADRPMLWVWPDVSGFSVKYDERFFHLVPDIKKVIHIAMPKDIGKEELERRLQVYSLIDTYC